MKKYVRTQGVHILLCLIYAILTCVQQISDVRPHLFYSVFPLFTLYYGLLSAPIVHQIHEYNTVEHTVPKWSYAFRIYYHVVLLANLPIVGIYTVFIITVIMMWKDMRFLVAHAEERLKQIDKVMYSTEETKKFRICHLHLNAFDDDIAVRSHTHNFNTNKLKIVRHSLVSEEEQNAIKNYEEYRKNHLFPPNNMKDWERRAWHTSAYQHIFLHNRDMYRFVPIIYILCGTFISFSHTSSTERLYIYMNTLLIMGDVISTVLMQKLNNDVFNDILYVGCGIFFLLSAERN